MCALVPRGRHAVQSQTEGVAANACMNMLCCPLVICPPCFMLDLVAARPAHEVVAPCMHVHALPTTRCMPCTCCNHVLRMLWPCPARAAMPLGMCRWWVTSHVGVHLRRAAWCRAAPSLPPPHHEQRAAAAEWRGRATRCIHGSTQHSA